MEFTQIIKVIIFIFFKNKYIYYAEKKRGPTEIRTRINGFKVQCANRYTIGPINIFIILYYLI